MIWFACRACGQVHGRPEQSVGATIFCACGQGIVVPWDSTAPAPAAPPIPESLANAEPLDFGPEPIKTPSRPASPPRRSARQGKRGRNEPDPAYCFNHETVLKSEVCAECGLSFCGNCATTLCGKTLCGPCKNHLAKAMQKLPTTSSLAVSSLLLALVTAPAILSSLAIEKSWSGVWLPALAISAQLTAALLGVWALRRCEADGRVGGRSQAISGIVTASIAMVLTVALAWTMRRWGA